MYSFMNKEDYNTNKSLDYDNYYFFRSAFDDNEIELIKKISNQFPQENATIAQTGIHPEYRNSKISWIPYNQNTHWLYQKLGTLAKKANQIWQFDITGFGEKLQYGEYNSNDKGHYDWHIDIGTHQPYRKISMSIQLTHTDNYTGGELQFHTAKRIKIAPKDKGTVIFFPSYLCHQITPVTQGKRYSLVTWITGPPFK